MSSFLTKRMLSAAAATLAACALLPAAAQEAGSRATGGGVIAGRVTVEGRPAPGVRVFLVSAADSHPARRALPGVMSLTDEDGNFRLAGVPAGAFTLNVAAGAYVLPGAADSGRPGRAVVVREGEELRDVDLALARGAVITGRVTYAHGQPLAGGRVSAQALDEKGRKRPVALPDGSGETDDRGIYRLYGLPPGRYLVSVGGRPRAVPAGGSPVVNFHPGVTDESRAAAVGVKPGEEVEGVDITIGVGAEAYTVKGRVVEDGTGRPVPNVGCGYADVAAARPRPAAPVCRTDAAGEFRLERVRPGRYAAFVAAESGLDFYSEPAPFEVTGGDVQGLEIRVRRGSYVSGVAMVEGAPDPAVVSQLSRLTVYAVRQDEVSLLPAAKTSVAPDGGFHLKGVRPGRVSFSITSPPGQDFSLLRVEHHGADRAGAIGVPAGESVSGVRLVLAYGKGNVRGQIDVRDGTLPEGSRIRVSLGPAGGSARGIRFAEPDAGGRFVLPNVPAGEYELTVFVATPAASAGRPRIPPTTQPVTVRRGADTEVSVVLSLSETKP